MKKIVILGAGRGQVPLIDLCHQYGCKVCVVSPEGDYPGFKLADQVLYADIRDKEKILDYSLKEKINGITTDQLDESVPTAAYIAEKMELPGIGYETSLKFTDKYIMRRMASEAGIDVPYAICSNDIQESLNFINKEKKLSYPIIIKPVDSSASRGVYKIKNIDELIALFPKSKACSLCGRVILEQYIIGKEYVVEAYTQNYQVNNLIIGHRDYFNIPDTFIPCATVFSDVISATSNIEQRLKKVNETLVRYFQLPFGITHAEYIYSEKEDKIYLVEIAARGGGVFISSELIPAASGINANELLIRDVIGEAYNNPISVHKGAAAYFCYLVPEGVVTKIEGIDEITQMPGIRKTFFDNIRLGMKVSSIKDKSSRKGPILVQAMTKNECYELIDNVKRKLDICVKTHNGEQSIIWQ